VCNKICEAPRTIGPVSSERFKRFGLVMDDSELSWFAPPANPSMGAEDVDIWAFSLNVPPDVLRRLTKTLAPGEKEKAESFRFACDQKKYIAGRGALRTILGKYLRVEPAMIAFTYGPHGKPALASPFDQTRLQFNLAHCDSLALLAVTRERMVGVDVEEIRPMEDAAEMAKICCSQREQNHLRSLSGGDRSISFLRLWTLKEAWLKATGDGISDALTDVEVAFNSGETPQILNLPSCARPIAAEWAVRALKPSSGHLGAVALPGKIKKTRRWTWRAEEESDAIE
jgi:4'-phosphopantetheinyl transferase